MTNKQRTTISATIEHVEVINLSHRFDADNPLARYHGIWGTEPMTISE